MASVPRATLPAIQLQSREPALEHLKVFLSEARAVRSLERNADAELFDVLGTPLKVSTPKRELAVAGPGQPGEVRRRVLDLLREASQPATPGAARNPDADALINWLGDAPTLAHFISGLGLVSPDYRHRIPSGQCVHCTWL